MALLEADGIDTAGQRGYHVLWILAQSAVFVAGRRGQAADVRAARRVDPPSGADDAAERGGARPTRRALLRSTRTRDDCGLRLVGRHHQDRRARGRGAGGRRASAAASRGEYWMPSDSPSTHAAVPRRVPGHGASAARLRRVPPRLHRPLACSSANTETYGASISANGMFRRRCSGRTGRWYVEAHAAPGQRRHRSAPVRGSPPPRSAAWRMRPPATRAFVGEGRGGEGRTVAQDAPREGWSAGTLTRPREGGGSPRVAPSSATIAT